MRLVWILFIGMIDFVLAFKFWVNCQEMLNGKGRVQLEEDLIAGIELACDVAGFDVFALSLGMFVLHQ